jgi:hypothetical protein
LRILPDNEGIHSIPLPISSKTIPCAGGNTVSIEPDEINLVVAGYPWEAEKERSG